VWRAQAVAAAIGVAAVNNRVVFNPFGKDAMPAASTIKLAKCRVALQR
jgi:hypothetical protein